MTKTNVVSKSSGIVLRKRKRKNMFSLYLDIHHKGIRYNEYLGLFLIGKSKEDKQTILIAEAVMAQRKLEIVNNKFGQLSNKDSPYLTEYLLILAKERPNDKTWQCVMNYLNRFSSDKHMSDITPMFLEEFQKFLHVHIKKSSSYEYMQKLKQAFIRADRHELIQTNPFNKMTVTKGATAAIEFLTIEEVRQLSETAFPLNQFPEVKNAFLFSCYTGLRYCDIQHITNESFQNGRIHLIQKKTSEQLVLSMSDQAKRFIPDLSRKNTFTLPVLATIESGLKKWTKAAGINKHVTYHVSRHTFATLLLTAGVDIYTVSKLMGHKNVTMTQRYAKVIDSVKEEAINRLPEL